MMRQLLIPILLQVIGVGVIIVEFVVPSAGILSVIAVGIIAFSIYWVFANLSAAVGWTFVLVDLLMLPVLVVVGVRMLAASSATLRDTLSQEDGTVSQPAEWSAVEGREGTTLTALRPAGSAMIDDRKYDVVSRGTFIDKGKRIVVVEVDGNRIVVKEKT